MENNKAKIIILILMFVVLVLQLTCVIPSLIGCMIFMGLKGIIDLFFTRGALKNRRSILLGSNICVASSAGNTALK